MLLQDVYASFLSLILAGRTSEMELEGLLEATGVAAAARDHVPSGTALVPELPLDTILELGETMTVDGARRRVEAASASDLHQARDDAITFRTFATEFTRFASRAHEMPDAMGLVAFADAGDVAVALSVPAMLTLRDAFSDEDWKLFDFLREAAPFFRASNLALDALPQRASIIFSMESSKRRVRLCHQKTSPKLGIVSRHSRAGIRPN